MQMKSTMMSMIHFSFILTHIANMLSLAAQSLMAVEDMVGMSTTLSRIRLS